MTSAGDGVEGRARAGRSHVHGGDCGHACLYTGDYSRLADRHMSAADLPRRRPTLVRTTAFISEHHHVVLYVYAVLADTTPPSLPCSGNGVACTQSMTGLHVLPTAGISMMLWIKWLQCTHGACGGRCSAYIPCPVACCSDRGGHVRRVAAPAARGARAALRAMIRAVVQRGGRCLLPIVALGRAQAASALQA